MPKRRSNVCRNLLNFQGAWRQYLAMMEKSTASYEEYVRETVADLAGKVATGELSEEEYAQILAELSAQQEFHSEN